MSNGKIEQAKLRSCPKSGWLNNSVSFALFSSLIQIISLYKLSTFLHIKLAILVDASVSSHSFHDNTLSVSQAQSLIYL